MSVYSHDTLSAHHQWDFSGCGMAEFSFGLGHVECLPFSRLKSYLTDPDPCFAISVEGFQFNEQRRARALAEIDGVIAGLQFLGKIEKDHGDDPYPSREQSAADHLFSDLTDNTHWSRQQSIDRLADINLHEDFNDDGPEPDFPVENTGDVGKAWKGLRAVRKGMKAEFRRFDDVTSKSKSAVIGRLRSRFPNFKALADCGALVYRDVLDGLCPGTFEEIFAFASLSHAMSRILVRQKRMEEAQVLSGVQRWRDCIDNVDERSAFDALTSRVWPSSCVFPTKPGQPAPDPHSQTITLEVQDKMRLLHKVATIATTEMGHGSGDASHAGTPGSPPASLEEDALNLTVLTGEEFDFSLLRHLSSSDTYVPPKDIDPRELSKFCPPGQHIPGYNPSLFLPPPPEDRPPTPTQPSPGDQTPPPPSPPALMGPASCGQTLYRFPITDEVFDCKATNLRNTITFLAVLAFASNSGDGFYLLSGSGKTTARNRIGSAWASERSKTERRLRREFFDPLKTAGADDASFLALLAVAKKFVVLGLLGTEVEVQDYLIAMSKEIFTCGSRQAKFIRWIFGQLPDVTAASNSMEPTQQGHPTHQSEPKQQNKRREPPERQPGEDGPTKKKQWVRKDLESDVRCQPDFLRRVYRCEHPGCGCEYHSPSGLSKHKKTHILATELFRCDNCEYSSNRRDLLRQHFVRQHGAALPPLLQETRRGRR